MSEPYESPVRNQLYQLGICQLFKAQLRLKPEGYVTNTYNDVDRTRFELVTEACKATVLANYTNSPFNLGDATVLHISKVSLRLTAFRQLFMLLTYS